MLLSVAAAKDTLNGAGGDDILTVGQGGYFRLCGKGADNGKDTITDFGRGDVISIADMKYAGNVLSAGDARHWTLANPVSDRPGW